MTNENEEPAMGLSEVTDDIEDDEIAAPSCDVVTIHSNARLKKDFDLLFAHNIKLFRHLLLQLGKGWFISDPEEVISETYIKMSKMRVHKDRELTSNFLVFVFKKACIQCLSDRYHDDEHHSKSISIESINHDKNNELNHEEAHSSCQSIVDLEFQDMLSIFTDDEIFIIRSMIDENPKVSIYTNLQAGDKFNRHMGETLIYSIGRKLLKHGIVDELMFNKYINDRLLSNGSKNKGSLKCNDGLLNRKNPNQSRKIKNKNKDNRPKYNE